MRHAKEKSSRLSPPAVRAIYTECQIQTLQRKNRTPHAALQTHRLQACRRLQPLAAGAAPTTTPRAAVRCRSGASREPFRALPIRHVAFNPSRLTPLLRRPHAPLLAVGAARAASLLGRFRSATLPSTPRGWRRSYRSFVARSEGLDRVAAWLPRRPQARPANTSRAAATVASISAAPCAADTKPASKAEGAK